MDRIESEQSLLAANPDFMGRLPVSVAVVLTCDLTL
jgi:hypothetical protein